jgi:CheY-like chemotaxis protein
VECLLVEKHPDIGALLQYHLETLGYHVKRVVRNEQALAHIAQYTPDVAVIDVHESTTPFRVMVEELGDPSRHRRCWVVGTSTLDADDVAINPDAFLAEPFTRAEITRALHGAP